MDSLIVCSAATSGFKDSVRAFLQGQEAQRVKVESYVPRVKVRRVLSQLLEAEPALEIEQVFIRGTSGCSNFVGSMRVDAVSGSHHFDFRWCCRWKAEEQGYLDCFGFPDQLRAATEFDWRCFQRWERRITS